ncbi:MAG: hypothetical protein WCS37_13975 [Chloroflexota bacterium]
MKIKFYYVLLVLLLLSLGLVACGEAAPTSPSNGVATATSNVAAVTTAPIQTTTPNVVTLPTTTPLPTTAAAATTTTASQSTTSAATTTTASQSTTSAATTAPPVVETIKPKTASSTTKVNNSVRLAYVDGGSLYVIEVATKVKKLLVQGGQQTIQGDPTWSPDDSQIIVALQSKTKVAGTSRAELYTVNPESGETKRLLTAQPDNASDTEPVWSPDGTTLAFTRLFPTTTTEPLRGRHEVWLVDANGQNPRKLADGQQPAWSPDNLRLAFVTDGVIKPGLSIPQGNALHLINAKGQNEWEPLTAAKVPNDLSKFNYPFGGAAYILQYPVFLEGGKTLGFTTIGATGLVLTINSSTGGDLKMWSGQPEGGFGRAFAQPKGGSLLMYESFPPSGVRVVSLVDVTKTPGGDKPALQNFGAIGKGEALFPAWSPDGSQIAYASTSTNGSATSANATLVIGKVGSTDTTELVKGTITGVDWSN